MRRTRLSGIMIVMVVLALLLGTAAWVIADDHGAELPIEEFVSEETAEPPLDDVPVDFDDPVYDEWIRYFTASPEDVERSDEVLATTSAEANCACEPAHQPEPSTMVLAGAGASLVSLYLWRRRKPAA